MNFFKLSKSPLSVKILSTMALLGIGITYLVLALHIHIDTEFKVSMIKEAYSTFEWIELTDQTHKYFPYYGIYIFAFSLFIFVLGTSYKEQLKIFITLLTGILIILDIGSMWAIPYLNAGFFAWVLFFAGNFLALTFAAIFLLTMREIWLVKSS